jgi:hypothetical protein
VMKGSSGAAQAASAGKTFDSARGSDERLSATREFGGECRENMRVAFY